MMLNRKIGLADIFCSIGSGKIKIIKFADLVLGTLLAWLVKAKPSASGGFKDPLNKILVIRPGGIGDAIFLLPFLRAIKKNDPTLKIDVLCEKRNSKHGFIAIISR